MRRLLSRKSKETIQRPIENEVDYQEGILRVSAPQFNKINYPVKLNPRMTAGDLLTKYVGGEGVDVECLFSLSIFSVYLCFVFLCLLVLLTVCIFVFVALSLS